MEHRALGKTGLQVSVIGFGGAPSGLANYLGAWDPTAEAAARQVEDALRHAVERGVNYFDTAPGYGGGLSEGMYGRALRPVRDQVVLATKVTGQTAAEVIASVEASLQRLQTDYVDIIQYHGGWYTDADVDRMLGPNGALEGMARLRRQGKVHWIGFTTEGDNGPVTRLIASGQFDMMQICYNLIYQGPCDPSRKAGVLYEAEAQGMGIVTMRPLTSGILQHWLRHLDPALESQVDWARHLLGFVLSNPMVDVALVGMRSAARVDQNIAVAEDLSARIDLDAMHTRYV
jgi:hypothetical protein